jgi:thiol-disulfide isomerase/thioredoxin
MTKLQLEDILQSSLKMQQGLVKTASFLTNHDKNILAFMTSWCPHCRNFSPKLTKYIQQNPHIGVVVIPAETNQHAFAEYFKTMPLFATIDDWEHAQTISPKLMKLLDLDGFPSMRLIDRDGTVLSHDVRRAVESGTKL